MSSTKPESCGAGMHDPRGLLLQWHITDRCNRRCSHCYQESYSGEELPFSDLLRVVSQFKDLLGRRSGPGKEPPVRGHVTVTGGEPFVRRDMLDLLEVLAANRAHFSFAVLTNGSFIDEAMARRLRGLGPAFVQVSIEGTRDTHDAIRGPGDFNRTLVVLKTLARERIRTMISFTAHRGNFREFVDVARLGRRLRVSRVWADRMIPFGAGSGMKDRLLTPLETREFFEIMHRARTETARSRRGRTTVAMHRALQFLVAGGRPYHCAAGDTLITVQPNGDLYPCRRMPIRVGNLMESSLAELYHGSELFRALRDRRRISDGCQDCFHAETCRGGLRCLSYAVSGDPFEADPGCWRTSPATPNGRVATTGPVLSSPGPSQ